MPAQVGIFAFRHAELVEASLYLLFRFLAYARNDETFRSPRINSWAIIIFPLFYMSKIRTTFHTLLPPAFSLFKITFCL